MPCVPCPHMPKSNISSFLSTCFSRRWDTNIRTWPYLQMKYFHYLLLIIQFSNVWLGALWNGNFSKKQPNVTRAPAESEQKSWACPHRACRTVWPDPCYLWQVLFQQDYTILSSQEQFRYVHKQQCHEMTSAANVFILSCTVPRAWKLQKRCTTCATSNQTRK